MDSRRSSVPHSILPLLCCALGLSACASSRPNDPELPKPVLVKAEWDDESSRKAPLDLLWRDFQRHLFPRERVVQGSPGPGPSDSARARPGRPRHEGGERRQGGFGEPGFEGGGGRGHGGRPPPPAERASEPRVPDGQRFLVAATVERWDLRDPEDSSARDTIRLSLRLVHPSTGRAAWRSLVGCGSPSSISDSGTNQIHRPACLDSLLESSALAMEAAALDAARRMSPQKAASDR